MSIQVYGCLCVCVSVCVVYRGFGILLPGEVKRLKVQGNTEADGLTGFSIHELGYSGALVGFMRYR